MKFEYINDQCLNNIIVWNNNTNEAFLKQWAGPIYKYPITKEQIINRIKLENINTEKASTLIFSIHREDAENIGTIELNNINYLLKEAVIGRFLINPNIRNQGNGEKALIDFINKMYKEYGIINYKLKVLSSNINARHCYKRIGFIETNTIETSYKDKNNNAISVIEMEYRSQI